MFSFLMRGSPKSFLETAIVIIYHTARDYFLQRGDGMDTFTKLKKFIEPGSLALVGISSRVGKSR